jgi:ribosomal protein S18 acetylase RimI-like enzyme
MTAVTTEITLRNVTAADDSFLRQLYRSTREDELQLLPWSTDQKKAFVEMQYLAQSKSYAAAFPSALHQLVLLSHEPIGRIMTNDTDNKLHLVDISLLARYRNLGVGKHLIKELLNEASRNGKPVVLQVQKTNRARSLYERLGFRISGEQGLYYEMVWED